MAQIKKLERLSKELSCLSLEDLNFVFNYIEGSNFDLFKNKILIEFKNKEA